VTDLPDDHEDDLPTTEPISLPSLAADHFDEAQEAPTLPPPPVDEALAAAVAGMVIAAIGSRLDGIKGEVASLTDLVHECRNWERDAGATIGAIDRGLTSALSMSLDSDAKLIRLTDAVTALTNQVFLLTAASHQERETATHRYDSAMARIVKLEDYRREQTGENDGSMSAAVAAIKGSGFPVAE
jgi:hypothetical protein